MSLDFPKLRRAILLLLVSMAATLTTTCSRPSSKAQRVLIVTIDTLRTDRLGYAGSDVETPNLDALAASGTTFTHAVTVAPLTLPAHASLFTGLYPPGHGVRANGIFRLEDDVETAAEVFKQAGFTTGAFVGSFVLDRRFGLGQGFDHYDDELPEVNKINPAYFADRPASEVVDRATAWIRGLGDEPFFAWVHVFDPHAPYNPPSLFAERYADRLYDGEIAYTDKALGPLLDLVSAMEDSLIVVTSDHGESLGEHGESTHGLYLYDSTTRIPLIMSGTGMPEGKTFEPLVRIVDIAPTVLELAGLALSMGTDGESLVTSLAADAPSAREAYAESLLPRYSFNWSELRSLRRGSLKLIWAPRPELFDVDADPDEANNLWGGPREKEATTMASELARIQAGEGVVAKPLELDAQTVRKLESLGYIGSTASGAVDKAERVDPKDRVEVYERMQELLSPDLTAEATIAGHRAILEIEPTNTLARNRLANTLSEQGRFDEAAEEYRRLMRDSEIDFRGLENLSAVLLLSSRTEEALSATEMAVAAAPWNPDFLVLRGEAFEQAGRMADARDAYASAVELEASPENLWRLGAVFEKLHNVAEAEARYRRALERDEAFESALAALARLLVKNGRTAEAYELLDEAPAGVHRDSAAIATAEAEAHVAVGRDDEALTLLEKTRSAFPENTRVLALLGPLYARKGRIDAAVSTLEAAQSLGETSPDIGRNLAILYLRLGKSGEAIRQLERARETAPDSPAIWYSLGNAYFQTGAKVKAVDAFERALKLRGTWPEAAFNLGIAAQQIGQNDKAAEAFRRFLQDANAADTKRREEAERRLRRLTGG